MPRRKNPVPSYRLHKQSGQAIVTIRLADGQRKDVLLGAYNSPESKQEYERLLAELRVSLAEPVARPGWPMSTITMNEVLLAFARHADKHYRDAEGKITREVTEYRQCGRLLRELYGPTPAKEFGPLALKAIRQRMIDNGLCRGLVNRRIGRIRRMMKWAASEELVPAAVYTSLGTVAGLQRGKSEAREAEPVKPISEVYVRATMPFVRPHVAAMMELQLLTGMRPGEACRLRMADIDTSGAVWLYRPSVHKNAWRGKPRVIAIGPRAQAIIEKFRTASPTECLFSPRRSVDALHDERAAKRKTPRYGAQRRRYEEKQTRRPTRLKRGPSERYTTLSYGHAIEKGIERANREQARLYAECGPNLPVVPRWQPNQIRHEYATKVRKQHGLEAAQVLLGHARADVTQVYAERDQSLAMKVAAELG